MSDNDVAPSGGSLLAEWGSFLKSVPGAGKAIARLVTGAADAGASWIDILKAMGEQKASAIRSDTASAAAVSKAITKEAIKYVTADEALAERAVTTFMSDAIRKQQNRESVAKAAIEDLEADPPAADTPGPSDDWLNRFQRYAEDVSAEEVQIMWGRVLAAEIRHPGAVSPRALRMIEEIDRRTADIFNGMRGSICSGSIIKCISEAIVFDELVKLVESGLIVDPGISGHIRRFSKGKNNGGEELWILPFGDHAVSFMAGVDLSAVKGPSVIFDIEPTEFQALTIDNGIPQVEVYLLTSVGEAISNIIFKKNYDVVREYGRRLSEVIKPNPIYIYGKIADGKFVILEEMKV